MDEPPFFIFGCGRSGTTLLREMLNAHSRIAIPTESLFIADYLRAEDGSVVRRLARNEYEVKEWGLTEEERDVTGKPSQIVQRLHEVYAAKYGKERWGQKTPRLVRFVDRLKRSFPDAMFIHVVRDPRGVVSSLIRSDVHQSNALYASRRWLRDVMSGFRAEEEYGALRVQYSSLVRDPEQVLERVTSFLNESFEESMLHYYDDDHEYSSYYDSIHSKLSDPPDPSRVTAWEDELSDRDQAVVCELCRDVGGFDLPDRSAPNWYYAWLRFERLRGLASQAVHYARHRRGYLCSFLRRKVRLGSSELLTDVNY